MAKQVMVNFSFKEIALDVDKSAKNAIAEYQKRITKDLEKSTQAWSKPVEFEINENKESVTISTEDNRYQWVDEGTKPHDIRPKKARTLRWLPGGKVRNEIARRQANAERRDVAIYATKVSHPGIRPRSITARVMKRHESKIVSSVSDAIMKAVK